MGGLSESRGPKIVLIKGEQFVPAMAGPEAPVGVIPLDRGEVVAAGAAAVGYPQRELGVSHAGRPPTAALRSSSLDGAPFK
jgi:hypothetical protein